MSIYKDCDIRGIYNKEFGDYDAYLIGKAVGTILEGKDIVVCGDVRLSTNNLKTEFIKGLMECDAKIVDIGIGPTPVAYYAKSKNALNTYGLAVITASHNPAQYNGIKLMFGDMPILPSMIQRIKAIVEKEEFILGAGSYKKTDVLNGYQMFLHSLVTDSNKKVVLDCGNGAAGINAPEIFKDFGYEVVELFCQPDGSFPNRNPNPAVYSHLQALCEKVKQTNADYGIAFDGDGDRVVLVDDNGEVVTSEKTFVVLIRDIADEERFSVVYDQKCSSIVPKEIRHLGGEALMERSGHVFIKKTFLENKSVLAGEISGHFFFRELGYDDGIYTALKVGEIIEKNKKRFSDMLKEISSVSITPDIRIPVPYDRQDAILQRIKELYAQYPINELDGVRVELPFGWLLVRKSVTEPALTVRIEAENDSLLKTVKEEITGFIPELKL